MHRAVSKPTIAVDIDDVLAANAEGFVRFSNERWGTNLKPDDYTEHWSELWGVDHEEMERRRQVIIKEKLFVNHHFFDEAKPVLRKLAKRYRLLIVSSRGQHVQQDTIDWITREYIDIFEGIYFADMWDRKDLSLEERLKGTKTAVLTKLGVEYLIDDQPKHCFAAAEAGVKSILFGDYGWNRNVKLLPGMARTRNWQEVEEYFDELR